MKSPVSASSIAILGGIICGSLTSPPAADPTALRGARVWTLSVGGSTVDVEVTAYDDELANPYIAAERGYVDAVIAPHETRAEITRVLRLLRNKRETLPPKKHGNIPL